MMVIQYPSNNEEQEHWLRDRLLEILDHRHDQEWFIRNERDIHSVMTYAAAEPISARLASIVLDVCVKHYRWHKLYEHWGFLALKTMAGLSSLAKSPMHEKLKAKAMIRWGEILLLSGEHDMAVTAAAITAAEAEEIQDETLQLESLVLFLSTQPVRSSAELKQELIDSALLLVQNPRIRSNELRARLYRTLATLYAHQNRFRESHKYAELAYRTYRKLRDKYGKLDMMVLRAYTARYQFNFRHAEKRLRVLKSYISEKAVPAQFARIHHELGIISLYQDVPDSAAANLDIAITIFNRLEMLPHLAMSHHSMSLARIEQKKFRDARNHLRKARNILKKQQNAFGLAQLRVVEAYYALNRQQLCAGAQLLADASAQLAKIGDQGLRDGLAAEIEQIAKLICDAWNNQKGGT